MSVSWISLNIIFKKLEEDIDELTANQEAVKVIDMKLMTNVADIKKRLNDGEKCHYKKLIKTHKAMLEQISED